MVDDESAINVVVFATRNNAPRIKLEHDFVKDSLCFDGEGYIEHQLDAVMGFYNVWLSNTERTIESIDVVIIQSNSIDLNRLSNSLGVELRRHSDRLGYDAIINFSERIDKNAENSVLMWLHSHRVFYGDCGSIAITFSIPNNTWKGLGRVGRGWKGGLR